jgi:hypothetical protein
MIEAVVGLEENVHSVLPLVLCKQLASLLMKRHAHDESLSVCSRELDLLALDRVSGRREGKSDHLTL